MRTGMGKHIDNEKGLSLIEVIISAVIFAFVLLSFGYMFAIGQGLVGSEGDRRLALAYAQETTEVLAARGFNWLENDVLSLNQNPYSWSGASPSWTGSDPTGSTFHQRTIAVDYVEDSDFDTVATSPPTNSLRITVTVSPAADRPTEFRDVSLVTVVTRP